MCGHLRLFNLPWQDNLSIALAKKCKVGKDRRKVERDYMTTLSRPHNRITLAKKNGKRQNEGRYNVCTITSSYPSLQDHITSNTLPKNEKEKNTNTRKRRNEGRYNECTPQIIYPQNYPSQKLKGRGQNEGRYNVCTPQWVIHSPVSDHRNLSLSLPFLFHHSGMEDFHWKCLNKQSLFLYLFLFYSITLVWKCVNKQSSFLFKATFLYLFLFFSITLLWKTSIGSVQTNSLLFSFKQSFPFLVWKCPNKQSSFIYQIVFVPLFLPFI